MILKIGNRKIDKYNDVSISLRYDAIASDFSFNLYFDPTDPDHKAAFKPLSFQDVVIQYEDETLLTGILLTRTSKSGAEKKLINVNGYSKTGILEDSVIPSSAFPLQADNVNLKNITEKIIKPFGIKLKIDSSVTSKVSSSYKKAKADGLEKVKEYLCKLANQKKVLVTHNEFGDLVLTEANTTGAPICNFDTTTPGGTRATEMTLTTNGQKMHSEITLQQPAVKGRTQGKATIKNPYATNLVSYARARQSSGDDNTTKPGAETLLQEELKAISLVIELNSWELNGAIVRPNNIITVKDPELHLYKATSFFIEQVDFKGDHISETCTLTCCLPEVYSNATPINIFN